MSVSRRLFHVKLRSSTSFTVGDRRDRDHPTRAAGAGPSDVQQRLRAEVLWKDGVMFRPVEESPSGSTPVDRGTWGAGVLRLPWEGPPSALRSRGPPFHVKRAPMVVYPGALFHVKPGRRRSPPRGPWFHVKRSVSRRVRRAQIRLRRLRLLPHHERQLTARPGHPRDPWPTRATS